MIYRLSLGDLSDNSLRAIARKRQMSPEDLATSYILMGLENARLHGARYLIACVLTAGIVLFGVWLLSISLPSAAVGPRALHWIRELIFLFAPWPLTILLALWVVARSESSFSFLLGLFGSLRRIKLFGAEIELNEQTKQKIQTASNEINLALREYKERMDRELARLVARHQLEQALSKFIDSPPVQAFTVNRVDKPFRCTIHVPDPIRYGRLYQLVDYCPAGAGRGRVFSIRAGIVGRVWRTEEPQCENDLLDPDKHPGPLSHEQEIDIVMSDWGMTRREAENALKHRSYCCVPLVSDNTKVGVLYMDAEKKGAFDETKTIELSEKANKEIAALVAKVLNESADTTLQIELE